MPSEGHPRGRAADHERRVRATARRPRVVVYAYDVHPERGSEPAAGWGMIRLLAPWSDVWVLTRTTPPRIDGYGPWAELDDDVAHVHWVHVPIPGDPTFEGDTDHDLVTWLPWVRPQLEYMRWQLYALRRARALHRRLRFDVAWHLTWANLWLGSTASFLGPPFVLGPVGGGVDVPWRLVPTLGARGIAMATLRWVVRRALRMVNPLAIWSWRRARLILVQNPETQDWLPSSAQGRTRIFQNAVVTIPTRYTGARTRRPGTTAVFAGRLVPFKGVHLAIAAIASLPDWRIIVVGDGPERGRLEALARRLGAMDRVDFRGTVARDDVFLILRDQADVLLFPSLHDDAGTVVAEALAVGLPVVCLAVGGPPILAGGGVAPGNPGETIAALAAATTRAAGTTPRQLPGIEELRAALYSAVLDSGVLASPHRGEASGPS